MPDEDPLDDETPPHGNGALTQYRLRKVEQLAATLQTALQLEKEATAAFQLEVRDAIHGIREVVGKLDPEKIADVLEERDSRSKGRTETWAQIRNTGIAMAFLGVLSPVVVLVLGHILFGG